MTNAQATTSQRAPALPESHKVTAVKHYTDRLFTFKCSRPDSMRFRSGEFVMLGLMDEVNPDTGVHRSPGVRSLILISVYFPTT